MNRSIIAQPLAGLCLGMFFFVSSCTINVQKIEKYGLNDQQYVFDPKVGGWQQDTSFRFCCNGFIETHPGDLEKGIYTIELNAKGTAAYGVYPLLRVMVGDSVLKEIRLDSNFSIYKIGYVADRKKTISVRLGFDQDGLDDKGHDRDIFIRRIRVDATKD